MEKESALEGLRQRVGVEAALVRIVAEPEVASSLRPAVEAVLEGPTSAHGVRETAALVGLHPYEFAKAFQRASGLPLSEFVDRVRVDAALIRLATTDRSAEDVAREFGFLSLQTFDLSIAEYTGLPLVAVLSLLRP